MTERIKAGSFEKLCNYLELCRPGFILLLLAAFGFVFWSAVITAMFYFYFYGLSVL